MQSGRLARPLRIGAAALALYPIAPPRSVDAQTLRAVEIPEIVRWLRNGDAANIIVDRLTYRCLAQRLVRGTEATLRQAGGTDVVITFVRQLVICPDVGARDAARPRTTRVEYREATGDSVTLLVTDDVRHYIELQGGLALTTIRAWFNPQSANPRAASTTGSIAGVGPTAELRWWPYLTRRRGIGIGAAWAQNVFVGDGYSGANAALWRADVRAMQAVGGAHLFAEAGMHVRRGARTRQSGVESLRATASFSAARIALGTRLGSHGDPLAGVELSALLERAQSGADRPGGTHLGARLRWMDGPIMVAGEYVAGYAAAGTPRVLQNATRTANVTDPGGGNATLLVGLRHVWRLGR
ncbi:MAG: hypothetical protein MUF00_16595 [Gemmatimonadaceae bacterium]|jgi:hypothetical protein|nr:hypothetical protein [Gemmatimonadaceae bacterium]